MQANNLYVHFPFCRSRCSYCTLFSRAGAGAEERNAYVRGIAAALRSMQCGRKLSTVYFGGGTPAFCDLGPVLDAVAPLVGDGTEFTVELHPLDVAPDLLARLADGGVNRISMGVQSLEDQTLVHMGRGYSFDDAERAFSHVKERFDNAGIDLIVGYPGETSALVPRHARLARWGLRHCSVYALQNERQLPGAVDDATTMDRLSVVGAFLGELGLRRYEISNYAVPGFECRHNLAIWRGEDYIGLGDGACGRIGLSRTRGFGGRNPQTETVDAAFDEKERRLFRLRTREGLDASGHPEWKRTLSRFADEGLLTREGEIYRLTPRGTEVCDTILAELA